MSHRCFVSFKKEDAFYKNKIVEKLGDTNIVVKSLDKWIDSDNLDYVMQVIRDEYMSNTSVTLYLIGKHSSENEGLDEYGHNHQSFMIRELQATLFDRKGNRRSGLLGIVLPEMESNIFLGTHSCPKCGEIVTTVELNDNTVIREFYENYWLKKNVCGNYSDDGRYCNLVKYTEFIKDPDKYIDSAFNKTQSDISNYVHFKDIKHNGL